MRLTFTDRFVATVNATVGERPEFFDATAKGLALRVSDGAKSWAFHYSRDGRRVRLTLGTYPAMSLAQARTAALQARGHLLQGKDPRAAFASQHDQAATVGTGCDEVFTRALMDEQTNRRLVVIPSSSGHA